MSRSLLNRAEVTAPRWGCYAAWRVASTVSFGERCARACSKVFIWSQPRSRRMRGAASLKALATHRSTMAPSLQRLPSKCDLSRPQRSEQLLLIGPRQLDSIDSSSVNRPGGIANRRARCELTRREIACQPARRLAPAANKPPVARSCDGRLEVVVWHRSELLVAAGLVAGQADVGEGWCRSRIVRLRAAQKVVGRLRALGCAQQFPAPPFRPHLDLGGVLRLSRRDCLP